MRLPHRDAALAPQAMALESPAAAVLDQRNEFAVHEEPMALSQGNITASTPKGGALVSEGATFKVWASLAQAVYLNGVFGGAAG